MMSRMRKAAIATAMVGVFALATSWSCGEKKALGVLRVRGLAVEDTRGETRIAMNVDADGMPFLRFRDAARRCRLELSLRDPHWRWSLPARVRDKDANTEHAAWLHGTPWIKMHGRGKVMRIEVGVWFLGMGLLVFREGEEEHPRPGLFRERGGLLWFETRGPSWRYAPDVRQIVLFWDPYRPPMLQLLDGEREVRIQPE